MTYDYVRDRLCEEGKRLLDLWIPDAETWVDIDYPDDYNPFDHPLAHQRSQELHHHRWNCPVCLQGYLPTAREMHPSYLLQVEARIEELQMQAV